MSLDLLDLTEEHTLPLWAIIDKHRHGLRIWLDWVDRMQNLQQYQSQISQLIYEESIGIQKPMVVVYNEVVVGEVAIDHFDGSVKSCQLGYWINPDFQKKQIAYNACKQAIAFAFEKLNINRVEVRFISPNIASKKLADKLGFKIEGVLRQNILFKGQVHDEVVMGLLKQEWNK